MSMGFNSNVEVGDAVYHVQTEDRGLHHPFVDTVVLSGGRVVYRRSVGYQDLLSGTALDEAVLGARIEQQHREVLEGVRAGSLPLEEHQPAAPAAIAVRLCNPTSWLVAGQASLEVEVLSRPEQRPVAAAEVQVSIEGAAEGESVAVRIANRRRWPRQTAFPHASAGGPSESGPDHPGARSRGTRTAPLSPEAEAARSGARSPMKAR